MPRVNIDKKDITYDYTARGKYWTALSEHLIKKHGNAHFNETSKVEEALLSAFDFLVDNFKKLIFSEKKLTFFLYVFWLHEQSILLTAV